MLRLLQAIPILVAVLLLSACFDEECQYRDESGVCLVKRERPTSHGFSLRSGQSFTHGIRTPLGQSSG